VKLTNLFHFGGGGPFRKSAYNDLLTPASNGVDRKEDKRGRRKKVRASGGIHIVLKKKKRSQESRKKKGASLICYQESQEIALGDSLGEGGVGAKKGRLML